MLITNQRQNMSCGSDSLNSSNPPLYVIKTRQQQFVHDTRLRFNHICDSPEKPENLLTRRDETTVNERILRCIPAAINKHLAKLRPSRIGPIV